ncbi:putative 3'-phosphatase, 5'-polynucleotide kinase [Achromobacter phage vB_AxyP_19-32_Axy11]|uniref:Putative 3'-phosphatase, 5'-polynucleotide kinase n=1 Tax=Achromobacter phage vB_AxyP_19-32_Axy11 TaxID=2591042 RepID=A0A514CU83_9CAUD|nr:putative 3'-phosphatase, 5'-polynucleotide kinase [Achromobacter phage vB_AxyP_19-32_Axy11]QDH84032.1 putative 3'-phosphatase, 5'-polynucleotide kinase [Achromobacter phage vB_AxyP_19-32_Axy11]
MAAENSGGRVNYYLVSVDHPQREEQPAYQAECEDIIEALELNFDEANIFKEIWRTARARQGSKKEGNTTLRAAQKIVHYAGRILRRVTRQQATAVQDGWMAWGGRLISPMELKSTDAVLIKTKDGNSSGPYHVMDLQWQHDKSASDGSKITHYRKV